MRVLEHIDDYSDIYHPVVEENIQFVESQLKFTFPDNYKELLRHPDIEAIKKLPSLLWFVHHSSVGILEVNEWLRKRTF